MTSSDQSVKNELATHLTVIIPALNAAETLPSTLSSLHDIPAVVVDGGSSDPTREVATAFGAGVIAAPRGRGRQLAAGIAAATTPWLLLLHADTRLRGDWPAAATAFIIQHPKCAGYFRFRLDTSDPRARRLERRVAWRCRVLSLPYGDQGLLISRRLLDAVGGMRPIPLMEDVDLVRRLRGSLRPIGCDAITSAIKWQRDGWNRRSLRNLACLALWYAGVPPAWIVRIYR